MTHDLALAALLASIGACSHSGARAASGPNPSEGHTTSRAEDECIGLDAQQREALTFSESPGGAPEVDVEWVAAHGCGLHVVDVRSETETATGTLAFAEHVPLSSLAEVATQWDPRQPIVLACRSGRRSARAVEQLEALGFTRAASMTGGVLAWRAAGHPLVQPSGSPAMPRPEVEPSAVPAAPITALRLKRLLDEEHLPSVRVASLLLQSSEACVDGRETQAVIGAPGGDAGELLLALSAIEAAAERPLTPAEVQSVFDAHVAAFGRFYLHTDSHAMDALRESLRSDARFYEVTSIDEEDPAAFEAFLRSPPRAIRGDLLGVLEQPANIGCGHLRLIVQHPEEYSVRRELAQGLIGVFFQELWRHPEKTSFVVLRGHHHEEAVVNIRLRQPARASTNVPAVSPRIGGRSLFINHPEVSQYIRSEHAAFLRNHIPWLRDLTSEAEYEETIAALAQQQLDATVAHLAARLPVFDVFIDDGEAHVETVRTAPTRE